MSQTTLAMGGTVLFESFGGSVRAAKLVIVPIILCVASACSSQWEIQGLVVNSCEERPFFFDEDQDGWGIETAEKPRVPMCEADVEALYTARNARDCDDSTNTITGRVGAVCPCDLTTGDVGDYSTCADGVSIGGTDYIGWVGSDSEFLAVLPPTDTIWPTTAATACAAGWGRLQEDGTDGAWLATFNDGEFAEMRVAFEAAGVTSYAGFIGLSSTVSTNPTDAIWAWEDNATSAVASITPCGSSLPDASRALPEQQLAVVVRDTEPTFCLGTPANAEYTHGTIPDVGVSPDYYAPLFGHFICERPLPDPTEYWEPPAALAQ